MLLGTLAPCKSLDELCQTASGRVCHLHPENTTIYQCNSNSTEVLSGNEGERIMLEAVGDKSGYGCSFEITDEEKQMTCCYIHKLREGLRGKRLCKSSVQHEECRQPNSYSVEEKDGLIGSCIFTIFKAKVSDSGTYKIKFPYQPKFNKEKRIDIKSNGLSHASIGGLTVVLLLLIIIVALTLPCWCRPLKRYLEEKEKNIRKEDGEIMNQIKQNKEENTTKEKTLLKNPLFQILLKKKHCQKQKSF